MKKILSLFTVLTIALLLTACGVKVEVPPAHVGKIMTKDGYQEGLITTSTFRLPWCWAYCDRLILLDVSDKPFNEPLEILIPKDKLIVKVAVRTTLSVNPAKTNELFNVITPSQNQNQKQEISVIDAARIYNTYAQQIVLTETREYLSQFSIGEISSSIETVNSELRNKLTKTISERTPFNVRFVGITNIEYPTIITEAQENAAKRREQIQQEEAELQISKVKLEREFQEARLRRQIEKEKAETEAEAQRIQAQTIDPRVLELRKLENERAWIDTWNGVLPQTMLGDAVPMVQIGK